MNVLDSSKSVLGKLLATENIRVEHQQVHGPSFDVKDRVLTLPIWKQVDSDLYDLMIGHEVGHALFTPKDGWLDKVREYGSTFKTVLNLVEDARIEKKMKRKFPVLARPMYNGYTDLVSRGFFGCTMEEMNALSFLDRMNVYFKLGVRSGVTFNEKEQLLVDRVDSAETWDEVMALSVELHGHAKKDAEDLQTAFDSLLESLQNSDNIEFSNSNEGQADNTLQDFMDKLRDAGRDDLADRLKDASQSALNRMLEKLKNEDMDVNSMTQNALERNAEKLIDDKAYPTTYVTMPELDPSKFVVPAKLVHETMNFGNNSQKRADEVYNNFITGTKRYVNYMVKEFELRRNAAQFAKARTSKTGDLDVDKLWRFKLSEDLFLQSTVVPNGKNHGMLMVIDMSSSMSYNIAGTIEQMVSLVLFCRKVNIPFDVYGFFDTGISIAEREAMGDITKRNSTKAGDLVIDQSNFRLTQFIHSGMRTAEFNKAIKNLVVLAEAYRSGSNYRYYNSYASSLTIPHNMHLGGTPLNESIVVLRSIADRFKKDYKIEVLNTIILTDGDASYSLDYNDVKGEVKDLNSRFVIEDRKTKHQVLNKGWRGTETFLEMYKHLTGSRVIGIYLMSGGNHKSTIYRKAVDGNEEFNGNEFEKQYKEEFHKHKYFGLKSRGYDIYYMVPGEELEIEDVNMDKVLAKTAPKGNTLLKAFKKMQSTKQISRVFINQFIKQVA